jgi:hypothetical protein
MRFQIARIRSTPNDNRSKATLLTAQMRDLHLVNQPEARLLCRAAVKAAQEGKVLVAKPSLAQAC